VQPSLKQYLQIPSQLHHNTGKNDEKAKFESINSLCFEILGFDILIDAKLKPWLIEINHAPSFETGTCLDFKVKKDVLADTFEKINLTHERKVKYQRQSRNFVK